VSSATTGEKTASKKGQEAVIREKGSPKVVDELLQKDSNSILQQQVFYIHQEAWRPTVLELQGTSSCFTPRVQKNF
jgi:hypothetical protein